MPRLDVPSLCLQDGPLGIRFADHITAFPAGLTTAATWNRQLMYQRGRAHGTEARLKGVNVLLSPVMGPLGKHPAGGRNWEGVNIKLTTSCRRRLLTQRRLWVGPGTPSGCVS